jgi:hypothetical protein
VPLDGLGVELDDLDELEARVGPAGEASGAPRTGEHAAGLDAAILQVELDLLVGLQGLESAEADLDLADRLRFEGQIPVLEG